MTAFIGLFVLAILVFSVGIVTTRKPESLHRKNATASLGLQDAMHGSVAKDNGQSWASTIAPTPNLDIQQLQFGIAQANTERPEQPAVRGEDRRKKKTHTGT